MAAAGMTEDQKGEAMRAGALIVAAMLFSTGSEASDWVQISTTDGAVVELDKSSVKPFKIWMKAWIRASADHDLALAGQAPPFNKPHKSYMYLLVIDCQLERFARLSYTLYANPDWTSEVGTANFPISESDWEYIKPDTTAEQFQKLVCSRGTK
jgi:hypothetical protein